jgi:hypothetical protein
VVRARAQRNVSFGVGDSLLFPPKLTHGVRAGAVESVVVLGLMLHAPGVGVSPHTFVQWATGGDAVGPLCAAELASLFTSGTAATTAATAKRTPPPTAATTATTAAPTAPQTAVSSVGSTVATLPTLQRWPLRRGINELVPMHLAGASGLAAAPTNRLLLVRPVESIVSRLCLHQQLNQQLLWWQCRCTTLTRCPLFLHSKCSTPGISHRTISTPTATSSSTFSLAMGRCVMRSRKSSPSLDARFAVCNQLWRCACRFFQLGPTDSWFTNGGAGVLRWGTLAGSRRQHVCVPCRIVTWH